ncbi:MurR/RpiR family transcriptional regulator [Konateibacter massiliensis]|uniref:MurR/RpiR family transcriptional regulator n=1 Tax=Konateibacter massiliensis TaxID=2002841 RepID=UPI000C14D38D|nr:MurR/RpiR family transcriptional regulator [Konateibacter massiliensis]
MNPFQLMELHKNSFTKNDQLIYKTITKNPEQIIYKSSSVMAQTCGVSQPALSRFVKSLGYSRYQEFRSAVTASLAHQEDIKAKGTSHLAYFNNMYQLLGETEKVLTDSYMRSIAKYVLKFQNIFATGTGKSFAPAILLEQLMRKNYIFIHSTPNDSMEDLSGYLDKKDLLIVFSVHARDTNIEPIINTKAKIMLVTANPNHAYSHMVDKNVFLPFVSIDPETSSVSPILFNIFVELLTSYISKETKLPEL